MTLEIIDAPSDRLIAEIAQKIDDFNHERWEVKEKVPLVIVRRNAAGELEAAASAKTFGLWLLIDILWIDPSLQGQGVGAKMLGEMERIAIGRGCQFALLDTLNFQARPFYEKFGYRVEWTQPQYPREGCKYFMVKTL